MTGHSHRITENLMREVFIKVSRAKKSKPKTVKAPKRSWLKSVGMARRGYQTQRELTL